MTLNYWDMCSSVLHCALMYKAERQLSFPAGTNKKYTAIVTVILDSNLLQNNSLSFHFHSCHWGNKWKLPSFFTPIPFVETQLAQLLFIKLNDSFNSPLGWINCDCYCYCWKAPGLESESSIQRNIVGLIWVQHFQCHQWIHSIDDIRHQ